jgi:hypothetical protein
MESLSREDEGRQSGWRTERWVPASVSNHLLSTADRGVGRYWFERLAVLEIGERLATWLAGSDGGTERVSDPQGMWDDA